MGQADEGLRPLCLADRPALRDRGASKLGLNAEKRPLRTDLFVAPERAGKQLMLL